MVTAENRAVSLIISVLVSNNSAPRSHSKRRDFVIPTPADIAPAPSSVLSDRGSGEIPMQVGKTVEASRSTLLTAALCFSRGTEKSGKREGTD